MKCEQIYTHAVLLNGLICLLGNVSVFNDRIGEQTEYFCRVCIVTTWFFVFLGV